jgi:hypothetical protein
MRRNALTQFLGGLATSQALEGVRSMALVLCSAVVLLLAVTVLALVWRGEQFLTIPCGGGLVQTGVLNEDAAKDYAMTWVERRWSFQPESFQARADALQATILPQGRQTFTVEREREAKEVKRLKATSLVVPLTATVLESRPRTARVRVETQRTIWLGDQALPSHAFQVELFVQLWPRSGTPHDYRVLPIKTDPDSRDLRP